MDGIYPDWSCFIGPIGFPATAADKYFTMRQEARRKDIERVFGALQIKFHLLNRPSLTPNMERMEKLLIVCAILHNMVVEEKKLSGSTSVGDDVFRDAMDVDQPFESDPSELNRIHSRFDSTARYLKHLNDNAAHEMIKKDLIQHCWALKQMSVLKDTIVNLGPLLAKAR